MKKVFRAFFFVCLPLADTPLFCYVVAVSAICIYPIIGVSKPRQLGNQKDIQDPESIALTEKDNE